MSSFISNFGHYLSSVVMFVLQVGVLLLSPTIALMALRETAKARKDTLMPMLKVTSDSKHAVGERREYTCNIENLGNGPALKLRKVTQDGEVSDLSIATVGPKESLEAVTINHTVKNLQAEWIVIAYQDVYGREFNTELKLVNDGEDKVISKVWQFHGPKEESLMATLKALYGKNTRN
jgi:hypothetical protein